LLTNPCKQLPTIGGPLALSSLSYGC
jgi:hypothetical protein